MPRTESIQQTASALTVPTRTRWNPDGEKKRLSTAADFVEARRTDTGRRKSLFLSALEASLGMTGTAAKLSQVHRNTVQDWRKSDAAFRRQFEEICERSLDFVESQLFKAIERGDMAAITFHLRTKGGQRGYYRK
jgi:hypothetical protein